MATSNSPILNFFLMLDSLLPAATNLWMVFVDYAKNFEALFHVDILESRKRLQSMGLLDQLGSEDRAVRVDP